MLNEQPILIWSAQENKWISTTIYFTNQPATTTNILDIDTDTNIDIDTITTPPATNIFNPNFEPTAGYQELLPLGSIFPTTEIWYTDSSKTKKIIEKDITWSGAVPITIFYKFYASDGITIIQQSRDDLSYNKHIFPTHIVRSSI